MTQIRITNGLDLGADSGAHERRSVQMEALDTGATVLVIPENVANTLGLAERGRRRVRYADGRTREVRLVGPILIEILGREMSCDALVEDTGTVALIGQIPLAGLDLIVLPRSRDVAVNPASPDIPLMEIYAGGLAPSGILFESRAGSNELREPWQVQSTG